jgi:hypothetical protein
VTQLRKQMLEELQRRNYSRTTTKGYLKIVEAFAKYFHRSPYQLGPEQIRAYPELAYCAKAYRRFDVSFRLRFARIMG